MTAAPHPDTIRRMIELAQEAAARAYAPYSKFHVGACVLTADGSLFAGCNVENASYGLSICGERNAVFQAAAAGHRQLLAVVIVTNSGIAAPPCGACRQVLREFARDMAVICVSGDGGEHHYRLAELLPIAFGPDHFVS